MSTISTVSAGSQLQRPDFAQMQQRMFQKADTDGDGAISQDELQTMLDKHPRLAKALESFASTSDGSTASAADVFKKLDTDGDGKIGASELSSAMSSAHEMKKTGHAGGAKSAPPPDCPPPADADSGSTSSAISTGSAEDLQTLVKSLLEELRKQAGYTDDGTTSLSPTDTSAVTLKTSA